VNTSNICFHHSSGRRKPIAPTCNICLIRKDHTTIWCEVTSSIRTKEEEEDAAESVSGDSKSKSKQPGKSLSKSPSPTGNEKALTDAATTEVEKELLLCLRPIRDGELHDGKRRYDKKVKGKKKRAAPSSNDDDDDWEGGNSPNRPFKKRGVAEVTSSSKSTTKTDHEDPVASEEMDTDAAESLMLMTKKGA